MSGIPDAWLICDEYETKFFHQLQLRKIKT